MQHFLNFFKDGKIGITGVIFLALVVVIILIVKEFIVKADREKTISLVSSIAWFALAWGFLGRTIGLTEAYDSIEAAGKLTPKLVAGGFKVAIVGPLFGIITFIVARVGIIILKWSQKSSG